MSEKILREILMEIKATNKQLIILNNGFIPIAEKLKVETKKKKKQIRSFEASKHFETLSNWSESFEPTNKSTEYLTASQVRDEINSFEAYEIPLSVIGAFLNHYYAEHAVNKAINGGSIMHKVYQIKLID